MKFGTVPVTESRNCILAHSVMAGGKKLAKGRRISQADIGFLQNEGVADLVVAVMEKGDVGEDEAALAIAGAVTKECGSVSLSAPFAGRVNIHAACPGVICVDGAKVTALNSVNHAITLATLPNLTKVVPRTLLATAKIITYAVPEDDVELALQKCCGALELKPTLVSTASLLLTRTARQPERLLEKGIASVRTRLNTLGISLIETLATAHETTEICSALTRCRGEIVLLLTGSATSDPNDVAPAALRAAGGTVTRFGIPVDPGNLLFLGNLEDRPVIGLPSCARSPALNGADWVLERVACGIDISASDFAQMGVGGLLKEIPTRPHSRTASMAAARRPIVELLVLDVADHNALLKLLPIVSACRADRIRIVTSRNLDHTDSKDLEALSMVPVPEGADRAALIRAGLAQTDSAADAAILLPTDAPDATVRQLDRLIAAYSPSDGREICRIARDGEGRHPPALFGKRFFESLAELASGRGAAQLVVESKEFTVEIEP